MDTNRLRYFCTVARTENIHRASEMLRLSPAALSKSIKILEDELGIPLLVPSGRGIKVTEAGRKFAVRAEQLLSEFEALEASAREMSASRKIIRLASFEVFTTHFLGPLVSEFFKDEELTLHELTPGILEQSIVDHFTDVGITYLPIARAGLDFLKVTQIEMAVFGIKGAFQGVPWNELPFAVPVTPLQGTPTKVAGLDGWPDHIFQRKAKYRVTMMESALELSRIGSAVVYLPKFVARLHNRKAKEAFQLYPLSLSVTLPTKYVQQPVFIVKRQLEVESDLIKRLARSLREVCHAK